MILDFDFVFNLEYETFSLIKEFGYMNQTFKNDLFLKILCCCVLFKVMLQKKCAGLTMLCPAQTGIINC